MIRDKNSQLLKPPQASHIYESSQRDIQNIHSTNKKLASGEARTRDLRIAHVYKLRLWDLRANQLRHRGFCGTGAFYFFHKKLELQ